MIHVNNFRFGEISRLLAGRFDSEQVNQGAYEFTNARTLFDGGMARRFPLRKIDIPNAPTGYTIHRIQGFTVSTDFSYLVCLGEKSGESALVVYRYYNGNLAKVYAESIKDKVISESGTIVDGKFVPATTINILLDENRCRDICFAQYYERLYVASHDFHPFYIDISGDDVSVELVKLSFNQDVASDKLAFETDESNKDYGKLLFKKDGAYFTDLACTIPYASTGATIKDAVPAQISGFNDFLPETSLLAGDQTYPSVVAVINDCLWFANTKANKNRIWKSRVLGSSQWYSNKTADSMHDFIQFQVVSADKVELKPSEQWPKEQMYDAKGNPLLMQENGVDKYYRTVTTDGLGNYIYSEDDRLYREPHPFITGSWGGRFMRGTEIYRWYKDKDGDQILKPDYYQNRYKEVEKTNPNNGEKYTERELEYEAGWYVYIKDSGESTPHWQILLYSSEEYPYPWTDYIWKDSDGHVVYNVATGTNELQNEPQGVPYTRYKLDIEAQLYETVTQVDCVATDSCGAMIELNTGKLDAIRFISLGCDKIIVGTSDAEWTLPGDFNAVSRMSANKYSSYGAVECAPINLGKSLIFLQCGNLLREFYLYESYMMQREATGMNHGLIDEKIVGSVSKVSPDPMLYLVTDRGNIVYGMYDQDAGLSSFGHWNFKYKGSTAECKSLAVVEDAGDKAVLCLMEFNGSRYICRFEESLPTEDNRSNFYRDELATNVYGTWTTSVGTSYVEANNQQLIFGRSKKTKGVHIRPFNCGHVRIGNDKRQMNKTNIELGNEDIWVPITGRSDLAFSMNLESCGDEAMTILALGWETEQ